MLALILNVSSDRMSIAPFSNSISNSVLKIKSDIEMMIAKLKMILCTTVIFFEKCKCIRYINTCLCNSAMSVGSR